MSKQNAKKYVPDFEEIVLDGACMRAVLINPIGRAERLDTLENRRIKYSSVVIEMPVGHSDYTIAKFVPLGCKNDWMIVRTAKRVIYKDSESVKEIGRNAVSMVWCRDYYEW